MLPLLLALLQAPSPSTAAADPLAPIAVYNGAWAVHAQHPWGGGAPGTTDTLLNHCQHFTVFYACEQTVNGKPAALVIFTADAPNKLHTRVVDPSGLGGPRGDLTLDGNHWTFFGKPPATEKGNWYRTENYILDPNHIRFEQYESADEGKTWTQTNSGTEQRTAP